MLFEVVFVIFFLLWIGCVLAKGSPFADYANYLALVCVGLLGWVVFHGRM